MPMSNAPTVLLCRCANTQLTPAPVLATVLDRLQSGGCDVVVVDDLCGLAARRDPLLARLASARGPATTIIACFPRAVRWLFAFADALLPENAAILNMRTATAEEVLAGVGDQGSGVGDQESGIKNQDQTPGVSASPRPGVPSSLTPDPRSPNPDPVPDWTPWFPVIDFSRCRHCRQCANFCLFGVYSIADDKVRVAQPANCKDNCPACARLCPHAAIMFPKYSAAPINGDEVTPENIGREHVGEELIAQAAGGDLLETLRQRAAAFSRGTKGSAIPVAAPPHPAQTDRPPDDSRPEADLPAGAAAILKAARDQANNASGPSNPQGQA